MSLQSLAAGLSQFVGKLAKKSHHNSCSSETLLKSFAVSFKSPTSDQCTLIEQTLISYWRVST